MNITQWFGPKSYDEDTGWELHWYNRTREHYGERTRWMIGDLVMPHLEEYGGRPGPSFEIGLELAQADTGWLDDYEMGTGRLIDKHDIHSFYIMFWRWGICIAVRGRVSVE